MLLQTQQYRDADVVRSRDPAVLADLDVVIDVGGVYDPAAQRFDHHQRGFTEVFGHGFDTKLSSAGGGGVQKDGGLGRGRAGSTARVRAGEARAPCTALLELSSELQASQAQCRGMPQGATAAGHSAVFPPPRSPPSPFSSLVLAYHPSTACRSAYMP